MNQLDLFRASARKTDNAASHRAAAEIEAHGAASTHRAECLAAVQQWPGRTSKELTELAGIPDRYRASRRLPELLKAGLVRREDSPEGWVWYAI